MTDYLRGGEPEGFGAMPGVAGRQEASGGPGIKSPRAFLASVVLALAVVLWAGPAHLSRQRRKHEEPPEKTRQRQGRRLL